MEEIIKVEGWSNERIVKMLASHPIMIEDMKEIGRVLKNKSERMAEKNAM